MLVNNNWVSIGTGNIKHRQWERNSTLQTKKTTEISKVSSQDAGVEAYCHLEPLNCLMWSRCVSMPQMFEDGLAFPALHGSNSSEAIRPQFAHYKLYKLNTLRDRISQPQTQGWSQIIGDQALDWETSDRRNLKIEKLFLIYNPMGCKTKVCILLSGY